MSSRFWLHHLDLPVCIPPMSFDWKFNLFKFKVLTGREEFSVIILLFTSSSLLVILILLPLLQLSSVFFFFFFFLFTQFYYFLILFCLSSIGIFFAVTILHQTSIIIYFKLIKTNINHIYNSTPLCFPVLLYIIDVTNYIFIYSVSSNIAL